MAEDLVGIADAIEGLRHELMTAVQKGAEEPLQFALEPVEITLQAVVTKEGNAGVGWKVLKAGASYEHATTQTVTLKLTPMWMTPEGTLTANFTVASPHQTGDVIGPHK